MTRVLKCVKQQSKELLPTQREEFNLILHRYNKVRQYVFSRFGPIGGLRYLDYPRKIRDEWVDNGFAEQWHLPPKYWKSALEDAFGAIKSGWEVTKNKIRLLIHHNAHLTEDEKRYCFYLLKANSLLHAVLTDSLFEKPEKLLPLSVNENKVHNLLKRLIRKHKFGIPYAMNGHSLKIDENMYSYKSKQYDMGIQGLERGKQIRFDTQDPRQFQGNLTLVLKEKHLELHKLIESKTTPLAQQENIVGIDKGYRTLIATSVAETAQYGEQLNTLLTTESDRLNLKNQQRGKVRAVLKKHQEKGHTKKVRQLKKFNLGKKKYIRQKRLSKVRVENFINRELNQFFKEQKPSTVVVENLNFTSWTKKLPKRTNRLLSSWIKGFVQERLDYKTQVFLVTLAIVNPAYTSQICCQCGKFGVRKGDRFHCETHGGVDADYNAAVNLRHRINDREIGLYTPYSSVKSILLRRLTTDVGGSNGKPLERTEPSQTPVATFGLSTESELLECLKPAKAIAC